MAKWLTRALYNCEQQTALDETNILVDLNRDWIRLEQDCTSFVIVEPQMLGFVDYKTWNKTSIKAASWQLVASTYPAPNLLFEF